MEVSMEWNLICRVCLQEGEMYSVFEKDDEEDFLICDKIMKCSSVKIERGVNLPENICLKCLKDLRTAYCFRKSCENADNVLQSFLRGNIANDLVISNNGELYTYKPPKGLNVKRIPKTTLETEILVSEDFDQIEEEDNLSQIEYDGDEISSQLQVDENSQDVLKSEDDDSKSQLDSIRLMTDQDYIVFDDGRTIFTVNEVGEEIGEISDSNTSRLDFNQSNYQKNDSQQSEESYTKPKIKNTRRQKNKGEKPMHICEICANTYKHKHSLETHMRRHRNEKPFACEICGRAFVLNVELKCHMRTHTGQKPYACRYCGRCFSDFGSRIKHERTHTGERPYACETCGKAFAYSYGLTSHILTHTGEKPFECEKCGKRFSKKHHLKNHLNTHVKQENRSRTRMLMPMENVTEVPGVTCSEDEYTTIMTVLTSDQNLEECTNPYEDVNIVEIKEEVNDSTEIGINQIQS